MADEAVEEYKSSLSDLTFNSKPLINMLTMLADDSRQHAAQIVQVIEAHIQKAKNNYKLPALYLIDSILKNVLKSTYAQLFAQNIVATFSHVFEKVDEKTRQSLFKLRQTWSTIFPTRKLYAIDVRVNTIDPAWPITAAAPESPVASIHVNPKFINKEKEKEEEKKKTESEEIIEAKMRQQLIEKKAELLKLEQARLDFQLAEARAKLQETRKGPAITNTTPSSLTAPIMKSAEILSAKSMASSSPLNFGATAPPVTTASSAPSRRDPRLSRDPRMSRDPRTIEASKSGARTTTSASVKPASTVHASQHGGAHGSKTHTPTHGFTPQPPKKRPNTPSNLPKIPNIEPAAPSPTSKSAFPSQSILTAKVAPQTASIPTQPSQSAASTASVMPVVSLPAQATVAPIPTSGAAAAVPLVNQLLSGPQAVELPTTALNLLAQLQQALLQAQVSSPVPQTSAQPVLPAPTVGANQMPGQPVGANQMPGQPLGANQMPGQPMGANQTAVSQPMGAIRMPGQPGAGNQMPGQQMGGNQMLGQQMGGHQILGQSLGLNLMAGSQLGSIPMPTEPMDAGKYQGVPPQVQQAVSDHLGSPDRYATVRPPVSSAVPLMSLKTSASDTSIPWHNPPLSHTGQIVLPPSVQELREEAEEEGRFSPGPVDSPRRRSPPKQDVASIPKPAQSRGDPRQSKSATSLQKKTNLKETRKPVAEDKKRDSRDDRKRDDREDRKRDDREKREGSKESSSGRESDRDSRNRDSEWRRRDRDLDRYSRSDRDRGRSYGSGRRRSPSPIPRGEGSRRRRTRSRSKSRSPKSSSRSPRGDRTSKSSYDRDNRSDNRSDGRRSTKVDEKTKSSKKDDKLVKKDKKEIGEKPDEKKSVVKKEKGSLRKEKEKADDVRKDEKKKSDVRSDQKKKKEVMSTMDVDLRKLPKPEPVTEEVSMDVDLRQPSVDMDIVPKTCTYFDEKIEKTEPVDPAPNTDVDERIIKAEPPVSETEDCDLRVFGDIGKTDIDTGKNGASGTGFEEKKSKEERKKALDRALEKQLSDVDHRVPKSEPAEETPMDTGVEAFQKKDLDLRSHPWQSGSQGDEDFDSRASTPLMDEHSEPPAKKQKKDLDERRPSESTEDTGDLSDLFGGEDVDYRQPPKLKLEVNIPMSQGDLPLESPAKVGWAKFKAKHPEDFCFQQPQDLTPLKTPDAFGSGDVDMRTPPAFPISSGGHTPVLEHQEAILRKAEEQLKSGKITKDQYHEILEQLGELYKLKMIHREMRMNNQATEDGEKHAVSNQQEGEPSNFPSADVDERRPPAFRIPKKKPEKSKDVAKKERSRKKKGKRGQKDEDEGPKDMDERPMPVLERGMGRRDAPRGILKTGAGPRGILKTGDGARGVLKTGQDNWRNERDEQQGSKRGNQGEHRDESTGDHDMRKGDWMKTMPLAPDGNPYELGRDGWPLFPDGSRVQRGPDGRPDFPLPMPVSLMDLKIKPPPGLRDIDIDMPKQDFDERFIHHNDRPRNDRADRQFRPHDGPRQDRNDVPMDADWRGGPRNERPVDNDWRKDRPMGNDRRQDQRKDRPGGGDRRPDRFMGSHMRKDGLNHLPPHINLKMLQRQVTLLDTNQEVVIDQRQIGVKIGAPPRPIFINKKRHYVQVSKQMREVLIDDKPFYRIGDPPADCRLKGYRFKLYFHGPMRRLWIDRVQYDIRLDAPPQKIPIKGAIREIRANSFENVLFIDGISVGQLGQKPKSIKIALTKHELRFDPPPKEIVIDGQQCQLKLNYPVPVIMMRGRPHGMCFDGPPRELIIDDQSYMIGMHERKTIRIGKRPHIVGFLGPGHELMIDDLTHEIQFTGEPRDITISNRIHTVSLIGPPPEVKILGSIPVDEKTGRLMFLPDLMADHPPISVSPESVSDTDQDLKGVLTAAMMQQPEQMVQPASMPGLQSMIPGQQPVIPGEQPMMPAQHPIMPGQQPMMPMSISGAMPSQPGQMIPGQMLPLGQVPVSQAGFSMMQNQMMMQNAMMGQPTAIPGFMPASTQQLTMPSVNALQNVLANVYNPQQGQFMGNPMLNLPGGAGPGAFPGIAMVGDQMQPMMGMQQFPGLVPQVPAAPQPAAAPVMDIKDLFSKLVKTGMIIQDEEKKKKEREERAGKDLYDKEGRIIPVEIGESESLTRVEKIDDLMDLQIPKLKKHHKGVVHRLYLGLQCNSCGVRFIMEEKDKYQEHLDWHFRLNKKEKDEMKIAKFRKWYFDSQDWIDFEEIQDIEERARKNFFARTHQAIQEAGGSVFQSMASSSQPEQITSCPAASGDSENDDVCEICADPFEQFWDEESEEWHLKDAIRVEGKTYHPVCYEDAKLTLLTSTATPMEDGQDPFSTSFSAAASQSLETEKETPSQPIAIKEETPSEVKKEIEDIPPTEDVKIKTEPETSEEQTKTDATEEVSVPKTNVDDDTVKLEEVKEEPPSADEMEAMEASPGTPVKDEPMEMPESPSLDMAITGSDDANKTTEQATNITTEQSVPVVPKSKPVEQFFGNAIEVLGSQNVPIAVRPFYQEPIVFHVDTLEDGEITD
ncbi:uncharacterized protein LOC135493085 [Lineus longissimus]|uniref:uncharacterized protein LOC135493085 n=1 Tax=Lineus longissimus TaxID=88925 RepID=UPI002B4D642D